MTTQITHTLLISISFLIAWHATPISADEHSASDYVLFTEKPDQDCEDKGGARLFVQNKHQQKIIDVHLERYFDDVRQGGRSMFALAPNHAQALGCSRVLDAPQHWQLIAAEYISFINAKSRYGEVIGITVSE